MKKSVLTLIAIVIALFTTTVANAQSHMDPVQAFEHCRMYVELGDQQYATSQFVDAKANYSRALDCNASCPGKKFMSDRKINKKIRNCDYALSHGGVTREQKRAEVWSAIGSVLAVGCAATAVAAAASNSSSQHCDAPHHEHHHHHHPIIEEPHRGSIAELFHEHHRH